MRRTSKVSLLPLALALALAGGCLHRRAPAGWQRTVSQAERSPYGSWVWVKLDGGSQYGGELLAADAQRIYIAGGKIFATAAQHAYFARNPAVISLQLNTVESITIDIYRDNATGTVLWSLLGTASTITHGFGLLLSAPIWAATGIWASMSVANAGVERIDHPGGADAWRLRRYARYPEGLPAALKSKPPAYPPAATRKSKPPAYPPAAATPPGLTAPSPRIPPQLEPLCRQPIQRWRKETDLAKKALLYRDMPPLCKKVISRPARPATPAR